MSPAKKTSKTRPMLRRLPRGVTAAQWVAGWADYRNLGTLTQRHLDQLAKMPSDNVRRNHLTRTYGANGSIVAWQEYLRRV